MKVSLTSHSADETKRLAQAFEKLVESPSLILLNGDLGAGKTFFVKAFTAQTGSRSQTSSPSFSLINQYESPKGDIYHLDLYRIGSYDELYSIGFDEVLSQKAIVFIEWPDIAELEDADYIITIKDLGQNQRQFEIESNKHDLSGLESLF